MAEGGIQTQAVWLKVPTLNFCAEKKGKSSPNSQVEALTPMWLYLETGSLGAN